MSPRNNRDAAVLALVLLAACTDAVPTTPNTTRDLRSVAAAGLNANTVVNGEQAQVSPSIDALNASLATSGTGLRIEKAELLLDGRRFDRRNAVIIIAKDFTRGIGSEWVRGDFRRAGRRGVTYGFGSNRSSAPYVFAESGSGFRPLTFTEQSRHVDRGMRAWRNMRCSDDPIARAELLPDIDPDFLNDVVYSGAPNPAYVQQADVMHSGWHPLQFFQVIAGPDAPSILGVTFTFVFVDEQGNPTDIDANGKNDIALSEIYYTDLYAWSERGGRQGTLDIFSVVGHESGHALGLGHWGLVYVREKDAEDGITADEIRFFPKALMNAVYVGGENEIEFSDRMNFCAIWRERHVGRGHRDD